MNSGMYTDETIAPQSRKERKDSFLPSADLRGIGPAFHRAEEGGRQKGVLPL
jgi:hypothetical protein